MATTIKLKNGSGAPLAGDLVAGEPALDLTNKRLYTEDSGGTVIEVGTNPGTDVTFADNRKAIFGAGSDLQIYHDGSNSYIDDAGTGNLRVRANSLELTNADYTQSYLQAVAAGSVSLFHAGNAKLATTSTGIDVTGTVTADGLTLGSEGDQISIPTSAGFSGVITTGDTVFGNAFEFKNGNGIVLVSDTNDSGATGGVDATLIARGSSATKTALFDANGDISFYEDTGTTAKLFWDASAERLGIGTSSPAAPLHLKGAGGCELHMESGDGASVSVLKHNQSTDALEFYPDGSLAMTLQAGNQAIFESNVGIGTDSPSTALHVQASSGASRITVGTGGVAGDHGLNVVSGGASNDYGIFFNGSMALGSKTNTGTQLKIGSNGTETTFQTLTFHTNATEAMRIDSSGNVGIGESSPFDKLVVRSSDANSVQSALSLKNGDIGTSAGVALNFVVDDNNDVITSAIYGQRTASAYHQGSLQFLTRDSGGAGLTERMRIDSSGNLLVGKTSSDIGTNGFEATSSGITRITRTSATANTNPALIINRKSSDGPLVDLKKDGSTVGSIGSEGGDALYIQSGTTSGAGLHMHPTAGNINPARNGAKVDNAIDLGRSSHRFKDLYLSGGVYLGGTGSANHLDDYEEGTWTPTLSSTATAPTTSAFSILYATYTKVGRKVHVQAYVTATFSDIGTGIATITGLPFTPTGYSTASFKHCDMLLCNGGYFNHGTPRIVAITDNTISGVAYNGTGTSRAIMLSGTYETNE